GARDGYTNNLLNKAHAGFPGVNHVAGPDPSDAPGVVDAYVDDEITAGQERDARVFLVNRVALNDPAVGHRVFEEFRAVPNLNGVEARQAGTNHLSAAGISGHQMRLNEARRDFQVRSQIAAVDPNRNAVRRCPEVLVFLADFAEVV